MHTVRPARLILVALFAIALCAVPLTASAHPLGNFSVNRYSRLDVSSQHVRIAYVLDMAEIPTHVERLRIDANGDNRIDGDEEADYLAALAAQIRDGLTLQVDGDKAALETVAIRLEFGEGQARLPLLRAELEFVASVRGAGRIDYVDDNFSDRLGWYEIIVRPGEDVTLIESSAPQQDLSNALLAYPDDLLQSPPTIHRVTARFKPGAGATGLNSCGRHLRSTHISRVSTHRLPNSPWQYWMRGHSSSGVALMVDGKACNRFFVDAHT